MYRRMHRRLRTVWTSTIRAADYDAHMQAVGQAQANAELVAALLGQRPPQPGSRILLAGAGTGQMFDYVSADILRPFATTFTDINFEYLDRLRERLARFPALRFDAVLDDIEQSQLPPGFSLIIAVLVLEHVDWQKAVASMCALSSGRVFIVLQENPPGLGTAMDRTRPPIGTMEVFMRVDAHLLAPADVEREFLKHRFRLEWSGERPVPDGKKMRAQEYAKREA